MCSENAKSLKIGDWSMKNTCKSLPSKSTICVQYQQKLFQQNHSYIHSHTMDDRICSPFNVLKTDNNTSKLCRFDLKRRYKWLWTILQWIYNTHLIYNARLVIIEFGRSVVDMNKEVTAPTDTYSYGNFFWRKNSSGVGPWFPLDNLPGPSFYS